MIDLISRRWWLGLLGLACLGYTQDAQGWGHSPLKVHTQFQFRVEVTTKPLVPPPTAPWYAYFPADARLMPPMQTSPYPPWPMQYPPRMPPSDFPKKVGQQGPYNMPAPNGRVMAQQWPNYYSFGSNLQPVGFVPAQAPTYWYQGR